MVAKVLRAVDSFTGVPLENAHIKLEGQKTNLFLHKNGGFYVISNLKAGEYQAVVSCENYYTQMISFKVPAESSVQLLGLISTDWDRMEAISGKILQKKKAGALYFYYALQSGKGEARILQDIKAGEQKLKLSDNGQYSLEGRKFTVKEIPGIYTFGSYDNTDKKYFVQERIQENGKVGLPFYLLTEANTDEDGNFQITVPKNDFIEREEILFFTKEGYPYMVSSRQGTIILYL